MSTEWGIEDVATLAGRLGKLEIKPRPTAKELQERTAEELDELALWLDEIEDGAKEEPPDWLGEYAAESDPAIGMPGYGTAAAAPASGEEQPESGEDAPEDAEASGPAVDYRSSRADALDEILVAGGGPQACAEDADGVLGAIWRVRLAILASDYIEGEGMEKGNKGRDDFLYRPIREAYELCRTLWAAEGLGLVPEAEDIGHIHHPERLDGMVHCKVRWRVIHYPTGEEAGPYVTTGMGKGPLDAAQQIARTAARKQALCDVFGVNIHTASVDVEVQ